MRMSDEKKDLTGIVELAKNAQKDGSAPALPEGALTEEAPIEKIDDFESLEDYALANPTPELSPAEPATQETPHSEPSHPESAYSESAFPESSSHSEPFASDLIQSDTLQTDASSQNFTPIDPFNT